MVLLYEKEKTTAWYKGHENCIIVSHLCRKLVASLVIQGKY